MKGAGCAPAHHVSHGASAESQQPERTNERVLSSTNDRNLGETTGYINRAAYSELQTLEKRASK